MLSFRLSYLLRRYPGSAVYAATKDAIASLARTLAVALVATGDAPPLPLRDAPSVALRDTAVLCVFPGPMDTQQARDAAPDNSPDVVARRCAPHVAAARVIAALESGAYDSVPTGPPSPPPDRRRRSGGAPSSDAEDDAAPTASSAAMARPTAATEDEANGNHDEDGVGEMDDDDDDENGDAYGHWRLAWLGRLRPRKAEALFKAELLDKMPSAKPANAAK